MNKKRHLDLSGPAGFVAGQEVLPAVLAEAGDTSVFLVGGAVRDALLGLDPVDLDLVVEGDAVELALRLDPEATVHERFGTAECVVEDVKVDLATARTEKYPHPGSLPDVTPSSLGEDLSRRDFTINAMALDLRDPEELMDPLGGCDDLERGVLRVIHPESFHDDPTRALRAARYAARFGFDLEPATADLLAGVDLSSVSSERVGAELELMAGEGEGLKALALVSQWGLLDIEPERLVLAADALDLAGSDPWKGVCERDDLVMEAVFGDPENLTGLTGSGPGSPLESVLRARAHSGCEQLVARAAGSTWLDRYRLEWAGVTLEIDGDDLIGAGVPQGPANGIGLDGALAARLDEGVDGRDEQLAIALAAART